MLLDLFEESVFFSFVLFRPVSRVVAKRGPPFLYRVSVCIFFFLKSAFKVPFGTRNLPSNVSADVFCLTAPTYTSGDLHRRYVPVHLLCLHSNESWAGRYILDFVVLWRRIRVKTLQ